MSSSPRCHSNTHDARRLLMKNVSHNVFILGRSSTSGWDMLEHNFIVANVIAGLSRDKLARTHGGHEPCCRPDVQTHDPLLFAVAHCQILHLTQVSPLTAPPGLGVGLDYVASIRFDPKPWRVSMFCPVQDLEFRSSVCCLSNNLYLDLVHLLSRSAVLLGALTVT